jgi:hypothetical protein
MGVDVSFSEIFTRQDNILGGVPYAPLDPAHDFDSFIKIYYLFRNPLTNNWERFNPVTMPSKGLVTNTGREGSLVGSNVILSEARAFTINMENSDLYVKITETIARKTKNKAVEVHLITGGVDTDITASLDICDFFLGRYYYYATGKIYIPCEFTFES